MENLEKIVTPLLSWYEENARVLPWREDGSGYGVWVSEIMLQQTRVEAVKEYYKRFMKVLPTIKALAEMEEDILLKLWEGLGYYNRVRNMQKAAKILVEYNQGNLYEEYEKLLELPGIGSYTAGAIASIAYNQPVPAVDGNVFRVYTRLCADDCDTGKISVKRKIEEEIRSIIPESAPGKFNQALMELGAVICVPNGPPKCEECPIRQYCKSKAQGNPQDFPKKAEKKPRKNQDITILILQKGSRFLLRKRLETGLLAGLYEFPNIEGHLSEEEVLLFLRKSQINPLHIKRIEDSKHIFSHIQWNMIAYAVRIDELSSNAEDGVWIEVEETKREYSIPSAFQTYKKYLKMLSDKEWE